MKVSIGKYPNKGEQKISVRIDPWDTYSMDHTLAHIIVPMLKQLRTTAHGAPHTDDDDVPEELRSMSALAKENEWDTEDKHFERWDWILGEMIFAFESKFDDDWHSKFYTYEDDGTSPFGIRIVNTDTKGLDAYQARITNGFRLFGKYYEGLWD